MRMFKSPELVDFTKYPTVFQAGSIEMGKAEQWQERMANEFKDDAVTFINPRRDDWDASWVQSINDPQFNAQVTWELTGLELADIVVFYFDPDTKSPITLMELGYVAGMKMESGERDILVCCPDGFWRKGNVEMICSNVYIPLFNTFDELVKKLKTKVKSNAYR